MLWGRRGTAAGAALALALAASRVSAQTPAPLHGVVADLRLTSASVPSSLGWTPPLSTGLVPGRGFGAEVATEVFLGPGRRRRAFAGLSALLVQGRATGTGAPTVTTRMRTAAPHAGIGFGHADGWSYLSIGAGLASARSETSTDPDPDAPWTSVFHYGGGAKWFLTSRMAFTLELRFWAFTPRAATATRPKASATTRVAFGAGLAFH